MSEVSYAGCNVRMEYMDGTYRTGFVIDQHTWWIRLLFPRWLIAWVGPLKRVWTLMVQTDDTDIREVLMAERDSFFDAQWLNPDRPRQVPPMVVFVDVTAGEKRRQIVQMHILAPQLEAAALP